MQIVDSGLLQLKKFRKQSWMPLKLALVRSIIYIFFLLKSAEKCQFQNTRKFDASTPLNYPVPSTKFAVIQIQVSTETWHFRKKKFSERGKSQTFWLFHMIKELTFEKIYIPLDEKWWIWCIYFYEKKTHSEIQSCILLFNLCCHLLFAILLFFKAFTVTFNKQETSERMHSTLKSQCSKNRKLVVP